MTYAETRDAENLRLLDDLIDTFIDECQQPRSAPAGCPRQTVFFFPGGMASGLARATKKFDDGELGPQSFTYEPIWVTPMTPFGEARDLAMHRDSAGTFRDKGHRIIIADKALELGGCTPHDAFTDWCRNNHVDLFVFPWDWRRRLNETATFFVAKFLPHFRQRVTDDGCPDPLARFSLVGHSFGGMVANLILRSHDPILAAMTHVITVATPFYGYAGQVHRWFRGDGYLNFFGILEQDIIETIATLPALYTLHFLDNETFDANETVLSNGPYPIPHYPSMDATKATERADPYNPETYGGLVRYPGEIGFEMYELDYAEQQFKYLASPLSPDRLLKFHNIRGVKTKKDQETPVNDTVGSVTWNWIEFDYDAKDSTPIKDGPKVPGDGTQPAWTACLATNPRCMTVKGSTIEHAFLMNDAGVLEQIGRILCPESPTVIPTETAETEIATDEEVVQFLTELSQHLRALRHMKRFDDPEFRNLLLQTSLAPRFPAIARRFISDVLQRPGPEGLRPPENGSHPPEPAAPSAIVAGRRPRPRGRRKSSKKKA